MNATNIIKCASYRGTPKQQVMLLLLFSILASSTIFAILIFDVDLTVIIPLIMIIPLIIFISVAFSVFIFIYLKKYAAQSMEIAGNELRFFDKSGALKFSLPFQDIQSITPKPATNIGTDTDLAMQVAIQLKSGTVITVLLTDAGYAQLEEKLKASPILDTSSAKKIPLYMHVLFYFFVFAIIFAVFMLFMKMLFMKETWELGDLRILIWLLIGIGYIAYYLQLRRKLS